MSETSFRADQFDLAYPEGISRHFWTLARNEVVRRKVLGAPLPHPLVLDMGCGRGLTVDFLRGAGIDCWGVEQADATVEPRLRPYVFSPADAFSLPEEFRGRVGVILLLDVLEHLPKPLAFLTECLRRFPRLSRIVLTVPARAELWSNYDDFYGHYRRFDRASLLELVGGLSPGRAEAGYFFHSLYPVLRLQVLLRRKREIAHRPPGLVGLHRLLGRLFALEEKLLPRGFYGTSLWARAELGAATRSDR